MRKLDWKTTLIIITALLCVVAVVCVALNNGHDGTMTITVVSGFFGLAMLLCGKKIEKTRITRALNILKNGEDKEE